MATYELISVDNTDDVELDETTYHMSNEDYVQFLEEVQNPDKQLSILCCGPTGVGKSTLLNGIMGKERWPGEFPVGPSLQRGTTEVEEVTFVKKSVKVTVWDTPGLEGGESDDRYLQEIKGKCGAFDLFLYCIDCTESRATDLFDEKSSLKKITKIFGVKKLWKHAVVVLTQANAIVANLEEQKEINPSIDIEAKFEDKISEWKNEIHRQLKRLGYAEALEVPVVPAGAAISPRLLPGYRYWLSNIFMKVVDRMTYKARVAYLELQNERVRGEEEDLESIAALPIDAQPFVVPLKYKIIATLASGGVGVGGAAAGAAVGATIGAVGVGVVSFGVFAGVGLVVGGAVGAGVGFVLSGATALAARYFMKRRHERQRGAYQTVN